MYAEVKSTIRNASALVKCPSVISRTARYSDIIRDRFAKSNDDESGRMTAARITTEDRTIGEFLYARLNALV